MININLHIRAYQLNKMIYMFQSNILSSYSDHDIEKTRPSVVGGVTVLRNIKIKVIFQNCCMDGHVMLPLFLLLFIWTKQYRKKRNKTSDMWIYDLKIHYYIATTFSHWKKLGVYEIDFKISCNLASSTLYITVNILVEFWT